ncbi:capsular polysaccharide repeat unit transporter [Pedobacter sp. BAL39]|uniref:lipopolysaccharide biosynthesis protein n=1 Tax=Pedobacter sp. BAL39 TaxID=391596 RepID=UPI0001559A98|nr:lipopolysaccharide biosynthesis protein [Pedobacter sp. BAL39]EDM38327.1 capsular polysaccharide repeat unit transporter [Pedobacter sp. BAL39]
MSLKQKTITGLVWTFIQQFSVQLIGVGMTIMLARMLMPAEFGLIAMLGIVIAIGNSLLDSGLASSLIRSKDLTQADYSTVFFFNLIGSLLMYGLVYLIAPIVAIFYHQAVLSMVLRVYAIDFILNAFFSIQNARLTKEMNFKLQMKIQVPSVLAGGIIGLLLASSGYGVWSLVWMNLCQSLFSTVLHWIYSRWRPSWIFDYACFKRHFHFGYKMTLSGLLEIIFKNIYVLIIGRSYPLAQLGFYSRADSVSQLPVSNITVVINKVTYPMFSSIADDEHKLKAVYRKLMQQVLFWNTPALVLLAIIAEPFFAFLLTEKWLPAVPYFQILCLAGIMYPLHSYNLNILKVKGRSDLILQLEFIKKGICIAGIVAVIPFGIYGLLYFQLLFSFLGYYINAIYSGRMISYPIGEQLADMFPVFATSAFAGTLCFLADHLYFKSMQLPHFSRILVDTLFFMVIYLGSSNMMKLPAIDDFKQLILKR